MQEAERTPEGLVTDAAFSRKVKEYEAAFGKIPWVDRHFEMTMIFCCDALYEVLSEALVSGAPIVDWFAVEDEMYRRTAAPRRDLTAPLGP